MSDMYGTKMITHRWCLYCGTYQTPRAVLGANDLRTKQESPDFPFEAIFFIHNFDA